MTKTRDHGPAQLTEQDVNRLAKEGRHDRIEAARLDGRLDTLLGIERHRPPAEGQWTADDLTAMYKAGRHGEINAARDAGQLTTLLGDTAGQATEETA